MQNQKKCEAPVRTGLSARGRSARNTRVFSLARRQDRAGCEMLHRGSVGNTSRTERSTSPAAEICDKILTFEPEGNKIEDCCA